MNEYIYVVGVVYHNERIDVYEGNKRKPKEVVNVIHYAYVRKIPVGACLSAYCCEYANRPFEGEQYLYTDETSAMKKANEINEGLKAIGEYNKESYFERG